MDFGQRNLSSARSLPFAASSSRVFAVDFDPREQSKRSETTAISSIAVSKGASFTFDGLLNPLIFLTNCREAARISSRVAGGSKLKRGLMFLHTCNDHTRNRRGPLKEVCPSATHNLSPVPRPAVTKDAIVGFLRIYTVETPRTVHPCSENPPVPSVQHPTFPQSYHHGIGTGER